MLPQNSLKFQFLCFPVLEYWGEYDEVPGTERRIRKGIKKSA
jgi:hypothetical protein